MKYTEITLDEYTALSDTTGAYRVIIRADYEEWIVNGKTHRPDGPAVIDGGYCEWFKHDEHHRTDGPAVTYLSGGLEWWVNGTPYNTNAEYQEAANLSDEEMTIMVLKYGDVT